MTLTNEESEFVLDYIFQCAEQEHSERGTDVIVIRDDRVRRVGVLVRPITCSRGATGANHEAELLK